MMDDDVIWAGQGEFRGALVRARAVRMVDEVAAAPDDHGVAVALADYHGLNQLEKFLVWTWIDQDPYLQRAAHPHVAADILEIYGVPLGSPGIGVTPTLPSPDDPDPGRRVIAMINNVGAGSLRMLDLDLDSVRRLRGRRA